MNEDKIQLLDLVVDTADSESGAYKILKHVRPLWDKDDIKVKAFTEGYVNHMLLLSLKSDEEKKDALVLRVFGEVMVDGQELKIGKDPQIMAMQVAHKVGIAEPIKAIFKNGIVYGYAPGRTLTAEDSKNPAIIREICQALAKFHQADWNNIQSFNMAGELATVEVIENFITAKEFTSEFFKGKLPESTGTPEKDEIMRSVFPPKDELLELWVKCRKRIDDAIPMEYSHNDFHIKNMVYNPENEKINVLDYEIVGLNHIGSDLVRIPAFSPLWKEVGFASENVEFDDEELLLYAKLYIEESKKLRGENIDCTDEEVDILFWRMKMCLAFSNINLSLDLLCQQAAGIEMSREKKLDMSIEMPVTLFKLYRKMEDFFWNSSPPKTTKSS